MAVNFSSEQVPVYRIRSRAQLALLESPVRQEVIDAAAALGACSIAELAARLGRTPESLYFHVRKLVRAGLLRPAGTRRSGTRDEALYRTPGRRMVLDTGAPTARRRAELARIVKASLRLTMRDVERGLLADEAVMTGRARTVYSARAEGWLTPAQRARLAGLFDQIEQLMAEARPAPGAALAAVTLALAPRRVRPVARARKS